MEAMDIPDFGINKAHRFSRLAETCDRRGQFTLSINYHQKAIESFKVALGETDDAGAHQSLQLQIEYEEKLLERSSEKEILEKTFHQLQYHDRLKQLLQLVRSRVNLSSSPKTRNLELELNLRVQEHDCLLNYLIAKRGRRLLTQQRLLNIRSLYLSNLNSSGKQSDGSGSSGSNASLQAVAAETGGSCGDLISEAMRLAKQTIKLPKDDRTIIDELVICNNHIRELIQSLLCENKSR